MAKKKAALENPIGNEPIARPRLVKLTIRNFRAIGNDPVTIDLDDIVVLVGPNNCGKSSILRAYQIAMQENSKEGDLTLEDFPDGKILQDRPVEIELESVVFEAKAPGERWIARDEAGEMHVREKWVGTQVGKMKRYGWDVASSTWTAEEVPWGAPNVAQSARPEPHKIEAFDSPTKQTDELVKILREVLNTRIKEMQQRSVPEEGEESPPTDYEQLLSFLAKFQKKAVEAAQQKITEVENEMNGLISQVFPGHTVEFNARPEEDLDSCLNFFKDTPQLLMGPKDGYKPSVDKQGSGARRTLLWAALRLVKEHDRTKKNSSQRPHLLLLDEPELCLHPNAVREACRVLYDLPSTKKWQVMLTTHSPVFIDFWRDNTSIVRVSRAIDGTATGTTIYRPKKADLSDDDKECLKLLNLCDPYVAEFFFGGKTVLVEGDTEHTAFTYVIQKNPEKFKDVHIIRARGKATLVSLTKILNQFGSPFSILHDSDTPFAIREGKSIVNPAWSMNKKILDEASKAIGQVRVVASIHSFEPAYFGYEANGNKPTEIWLRLKKEQKYCTVVEELLTGLINFSAPLPAGAIEWKDTTELENAYNQAKGQFSGVLE